MRKLKLFFACLLMAVLSIGQMWGADATMSGGTSVTVGGKSAIKVGASKSGGSMTITVGANATSLSFYIAAWSGDNTSVSVTPTANVGTTALSPTQDSGISGSGNSFTLSGTESTYYTTITLSNITAETAITLASSAGKNRFVVWGATYETGGGSTPSVSVSPEIINFGTVEQGTSVANKTVAVNFANLTGSVSYSGLTSPFTASGSISNTGDNITIAANTSTIGEYSQTLTVQSTADSKSATVTVKMNVVAPFDGEVLEIKNTDFATSYASANGDHEFGCITITSNQVGNYSSSIQVQNNAGYLYNKTSLGEIAKIEITKTGNNKLVVYEGTSENPSETSITGVANDNVTTYTFSNGKSYFRISSDGTGASNVTPIKVYYHPASYKVTLSAGSNGLLSATVDADPIASGDDVEMCKTVTIAATPNESYKIKSLTVTADEDDEEVEVTSNQFVMPAKAVTVSATFEATKTLSSITLSGTQRTSFWVGETFSSEGLVVTAHYDDESSATVTPNSITGYNMSTYGNQTVTVSYTEGTEKTATYDITVKALPTEANPATVAEIRDLYDKLGNTSDMYVRGIIYNLQTFYTTGDDAGKYTYWITDSYDAGATPTHSSDNEFEIFKGLDFKSAVFTAADNMELGQEVVVKGNLTKWNSTYEFNGTGVIVSRPKVLKGIALSGSYPTEFTQDDAFSSEGLIVTASYNYGANATVTPTSITGYNMAATGNQTVTVSYTEAAVTKTATYGISIAAPDLCEHKATISKGAEENGTFELSVSGEQCLDELEGYKTSTVLTATPNSHYHLSEVTATVGTVGTISENSCTISNITANTTITAVFAEDDKVTVKFAMGTENATGDVPTDVADKYAGQSVTLPANPFTYTGEPLKAFGGWKHSLTNAIHQPGSYTITAADAAEDNITFSAEWEEIPAQASIYTSNVDLNGGNDSIRFSNEEDAPKYEAVKKGASGTAGSATITVPAGTTKLHYHIAGWNGKSVKIKVMQGETELQEAFSIVSDEGISGNGPTYGFYQDPVEKAYYNLNLSNITTDTEITFVATQGNRFVLFGVNAEYPAAITLDPDSYDFGEVSEASSADYEFTITPNAMVTGNLVASIEDANVADKFTVGAIANNKVIVTFTPGAEGNFSAKLKVAMENDATVYAEATLTGKGISAITPEITVDQTPIAFGSIMQDASAGTQTVAVSMSNVDEDGVSASISGTIFSLNTNQLTTDGDIEIYANTATPGEYTETLTLSATGATQKTITVTMTVVSKWAYTYTSNVAVGSDSVVIAETKYEAKKTGSGSAFGLTKIEVPAQTTKLHFHAAGWGTDAVVNLVVKNGDNELGTFELSKDAGVKSNSPYTLEGVPYQQYYNVTLSDITDPTEITFEAKNDGGKRFVLYGVNQEGGVLPVLESIEISGDLTTKTGYKAGQALDLDGLTVEATYTLGGVAQTPVDITEDPELELTYDPLVENQTSVTITATYKGQTDDITINDLVVTSADPKIYVSTLNVNFGSVEVGEAVPANETVTVTLTNVAAATATLGGTNPEAFSIIPAALTTSGDITISILANTDAAATYSATLTISDDATENPADSKVINLSFAVIEPVVNEEYQLVSDVASLAAGDQIIIVAENEGDYYTLDGSISGQYFPSTAVSISAGIITAPSTSAIILGKDEDNWTMSMGGQLIGATAAKKASLGNTTTATNTWTIAIAENVATITNTAEGYGSLQFNYNNGTNPRFLNYVSTQTAVAIYKKVAAPEPPTPIYETVRAGLAAKHYYTLCFNRTMTAVQGATFWSLASKDANNVYLVEEQAPYAAGKPYIIYAEAAGDLTAVLEGAATDEAGTNGALHGTLVNMEQEELNAAGDNIYILWENAMYQVDGQKGNSLKAGRAYIDLDELSSGTPQPAPGKRVRAIPMGQQTATDIDALNASETPVKVLRDGQIFILRGEKMYNVNGQIVK